MDKAQYLKPCLVIGTGFHRWVLGESMAASFRPLLDWNELLLRVGAGLGIAMSRTDCSLPLHWERMLTTGLEDGVCTKIPVDTTGKLTASRLELLAKQQAVAVLAEYQADYPVHSQRARLPGCDVWGSVVSLNFDAHWLASAPIRWNHKHSNVGLTQPVLAERSVFAQEIRRLNNYVSFKQQGSARRLWFPNGFIGQPASLRLGLREFGFQPIAIQHAFAALKAFERQAGPFEQRIGFVRAALDAIPAPIRHVDAVWVPLPLSLPLTWVTEMLYRPVFFAGVGLSDAEVGLWWLMVQRARNLANVKKISRPRAYILVHENDARLGFWRTYPCGTEPLICSSWDEGWLLLDEAARSMAK